MKRTLIPVLAILISLISLPSLLRAQDVAASLTGVVTDKTGAVIPDVDVKLIDTRTSASYDIKSNAVGTYTFSRECRPVRDTSWCLRKRDSTPPRLPTFTWRSA